MNCNRRSSEGALPPSWRKTLCLGDCLQLQRRKPFARKDNLLQLIVNQNDQLIVDKLNWKGEAKKSGVQMGDIISSFKIENPKRPNKAVVYPFAFISLLIFGYINFRFGKKNQLLK